MITRLYVHNFRCLENFELPISGQPSALLIGNNGAGKSTVGFALEVFQKIARGANRVRDLVGQKDLARGRNEVPMRFEIAVELENRLYEYSVAFELPEGWKDLRIREEKLATDQAVIYSRELSQVHLAPRTEQGKAADFRIDWHLAALPIIQEQSSKDPLYIFRQWLARMLILRPMPSLITGESKEETLEPNLPLTNFAAWFSGLMAFSPSAYSRIDEYVKQVMPDFKDIKNPTVGEDSRSLQVQFSEHDGTVSLAFADLSDGEKCFVICSLVLAANDAYGPLLCFWDEPDNYLAPSEVGQFILALRRAFRSGGQFIATSHNLEAIRSFSEENTLLLYRRSHLEPSMVRLLQDMQIGGDLASALVRGDV